jgi:hypothetical protein
MDISLRIIMIDDREKHFALKYVVEHEGYETRGSHTHAASSIALIMNRIPRSLTYTCTTIRPRLPSQSERELNTQLLF